MTAREPMSRYALQSRVRVRSSLRGASLALAMAGAWTALGWSPKLPLGVALFFAAVACLDWLNARYNERRARDPERASHARDR
jgi:hypothetical protein